MSIAFTMDLSEQFLITIKIDFTLIFNKKESNVGKSIYKVTTQVISLNVVYLLVLNKDLTEHVNT